MAAQDALKATPCCSAQWSHQAQASCFWPVTKALIPINFGASMHATDSNTHHNPGSCVAFPCTKIPFLWQTHVAREVWIWPMPGFMAVLPVISVAYDQECEVLPLGDLL